MSFEPFYTTLATLRGIPKHQLRPYVARFLAEHEHYPGECRVTVTPWTCEETGKASKIWTAETQAAK